MTSTGCGPKRDEKMTRVLYFAYGSNLDDAQMRERCANARVLGRATLPNYALVFGGFSHRWGGAVASVVRAKGACVEGLLYELRRQVGDKTVTVSFAARSPPVQPPEEEKDAKKPDEPEEEPAEDISEFNVYVSRPGAEEVLVAEYLVNGLEMNLMSLSFTRDYQAHRRSNRYDRPLGTYQGPELDSLDETMVERLHEYFESLGIDEELVSFVSDYSVHAELPGVAKEDIHVAIEGNTVSISAEVKKTAEHKEGDKLLRSERYFGKVYRRFNLGQEVDESTAKARFDNGVLEMVLPKKMPAPNRKLTIQ